MLSLAQFLIRANKINKGGTATICGDRRRTWGEIHNRVSRAAGALKRLSVQENERVAILSPNSDTFLEYLFSVAWAGGVIVPINTRLAPPEIIFWIQDSGAKTLAVADPFVETVLKIKDQLPLVERLIYLGDGEAPEGFLSHEALIDDEKPIPDQRRANDDLYALFYTGGTTGRSKGVTITHGGMFVNVLQWIAAVEVTRDDRFLIIPPMFHAAGGENSIAVVALAATAYIMPVFDVVAGLEAVEKEKLTKIPLVATMLEMVVKHPQIHDFDVSSVTKITYGASPIHPVLLKNAMEIFENARFYQIFGQTEGGPAVTALPPKYHVTEGPYAGKLKSAGLPMIGVDLAILDDTGNELPSGDVGEIAVAGPGVSPGYWNLPEVTAEAQVNGWLRTGDAGYLDEDGFLYIVDRVKDMIISGGENVYPAEVEMILMQHPAIAECAVIGIPSEKWGEQVHAVVRLDDGQSATEEELISWCREHVAGYKCIRSVDFRSEPFPLSATTKILKRELRAPYWKDHDRNI